MSTVAKHCAFPAPPDAVAPGLTKREHFASLALQGLMANAMENMLPWVQRPAMAVEMADALIVELNK